MLYPQIPPPKAFPEPLQVQQLGFEHLADILAIEQRTHLTPWTEQNFRDALLGRQKGFGLISQGQLLAYAFLSIVVDEAELLLFVVDASQQKQGLGQYFLTQLIERVSGEAQGLFLEVRAGNVAAINLYEKLGFNQAGERENYYKVPWGREDALIYALDFSVLAFLQ